MSFILDALRKSEIERQRQSGPSMAEFPVARQERRFPVALLVIGFLLAINLVVILYVMLRNERNSPSAASATQIAAVAPASVTSPPSAAAAAATPAASTAAPGTAPGAAAPVPGELPGAGPGSVINAQGDLYAGDATQPPEAPDPTLLPEAPAVISGGNVVYGAVPGGMEDAATVEAQTGLPPLTVDLHVFSDDPAKRAVFINGRRYTQGGTLIEGPTVEQITREGAVLSYRGRRFLLPRL